MTDEKETTTPAADANAIPTSLSFSLKLKEIPVTLEMPDGGVKKCVLQELDGDRRDEYFEKLGEIIGDTSADQDGKIQVQVKGKAIKGFNILLVSMCLFEVKPDGAKVLVPEPDISKFPVTVLDALRENAQKISGLKQVVRDKDGKIVNPSEQDAKNGSGEAKPNSGSN